MNQLFEMFGPSLVLLITVIGVVIGVGIGGTAVLGVIKRYKNEDKSIPWVILSFAGSPIVGVIYSYVLMQQMLEITITPENEGILLNYSIGVGLVIALAMIVMGKLGSVACKDPDVIQKASLHLIKIGAVNTVALFAMVFAMINLP